jgi:dephospho-CoA kinase
MDNALTKPVGLTGGIASGKSVTARFFSGLGAVVISADEVAAHVLSAGSPAVHALVTEFGSSVQTDAGGLNRKIMLDLLLEHPDNMQRQIRVLTPFILPAVDRDVSRVQTGNPGKLVMVEAPLVFEYGQRERYDPVIVVYAPLKLQIERLVKRSGMARERAAKIVNLQIPMDQKIQQADRVIYNDRSLDHTQMQVQQIYKELTG